MRIHSRKQEVTHSSSSVQRSKTSLCSLMIREETAEKEDLHVTVVVNNNSQLGLGIYVVHV
jgi:hypothetical protein